LGRASRPKQVLSILGKRTLLQETIERLAPIFTRRRILVVTGAAHEAEVRRQLPRVPPSNILVEPMQRNTTACLALAAEWLKAKVGESIMVATPADHVVADPAAERAAISTAINLAGVERCLVTLGTAPDKPDTGYGYIECGTRIGGTPRSFWVKRFREKPTLAIARRYVRSGKHLWNCGIFAGRTSVFLDALAQCAAQISAPIAGVWQPRGGEKARIRRAYSRIPSVSFDFAVMQPLSSRRDAVARIAVVRSAFGLIDAGNWDALAQLWPRDSDGNSTRAPRLVAIDTHHSVVYSPERLVALVGVKNLIVVDAGDVILVCARERAQEVRQVAGALKKRGWTAYL
jgi:mannose-1-phosphate guanylyltransferase